MTNEIPALTSNALVDRPDRDPTHRKDPYGQRQRRQKPAPARAAASRKAPATDEPGEGDAPMVGSRLDVRA
ncbi:MAG: hypothetical protein AB7H88_17015 [Vicinamibacterales bacterium]